MDRQPGILAVKIRELRQEKGMTQSELSAALGKKESTARMWEIGRSNPEYCALIDMAKLFGCTTDYMLGLSEFRNDNAEKQLNDKFLAFMENKTRFETYESELVFDINKYILSSLDYYRDDEEFCLSYLSLVKELVAGLYNMSSQIHLSTLEKDKFHEFSENQIKKYLALVISRIGLMEKESHETVEKIYNLFTYKMNENMPAKFIPKSIDIELDELSKLFKEHLKSK